MYRIWNVEETDEGEPLYWSNREGWVLVEQADLFTGGERESVNLPLGGAWERA